MVRRTPSALASIALACAGCGTPAAGPGGGAPAVTTVAVAAPEVRLEVTSKLHPDAEVLSLDMATFTVRVRSKDPANLAVPGPPSLDLVVRPKGGGDPLRPAPHPMRSDPPRSLPVSVEAGESVVLGPFDFAFLDLDPREVRPGEVYRIDATYRPGEGLAPVTATAEAVLAKPEWYFPARAPLDAAPANRRAVPLEVLDAAGRPRVRYRWSPDLGYDG